MPTGLSETLRAGADRYAQAVCGLPDCGKPLYMEWVMSRAIYLTDTAMSLADPAGAHSSSWQVTCEGGHTILVPPDTAEDDYTFGECRCDPTDRPLDDLWCGHGDLGRLRAVLGIGEVSAR